MKSIYFYAAFLLVLALGGISTFEGIDDTHNFKGLEDTHNVSGIEDTHNFDGIDDTHNLYALRGTELGNPGS